MKPRDQQYMYEKTYHDPDEVFASSGNKINKLMRIISSLELPATRKPKLLDLACNDGYFARLFPDLDYYGADIIQVKDDNPLKDRIRQADLSKGFPYEAGEFDVVFASEILEHIFDTDFFVAECSRVLRKDGVLILSTPNSVPLHSRVRTLLFGTRPYSTEARVVVGESPGHIRAFTLNDLKSILSDNHFMIKKTYGEKMLLIPFGKRLADVFPTLSTGFIIKAVNVKD